MDGIENIQTRRIVIDRVIQDHCSYYNFYGFEEFSSEELDEIAVTVNRLANLNRSAIRFLEKQMSSNNLFKGERNNVK